MAFDLTMLPWLIFMITAIIAGIFRFKSLPPSLRYFWLVVLQSFITEMIASYARIRYHNNIVVYTTYVPINFTLTTLGFYQELRSRWLLRVLVAFWVFYFVNMVFWQPLTTIFASNAWMTSMVFTSMWSLWYFYRILQLPATRSVFNYSLFWICCGHLLYIATCLPQNALHNAMGNDLRAHYWFQIIRDVANVFLYVCFAITFLRKQEKPELNPGI
ncbi:hypothetical protein BWI93_07670 [Siphonobacter sp. BAB-5385]|uniref:hypothetical protein n=1 Tax=Siphonobacter sp. BAB-5385 TaxID=1864822 RepID=UPI000B9E1BF6|nr:hypothetical protein [Siphonobacter sp. BAB-5385]OZI08723.1 hypothetical protein BWI93_07670 [Siphonobacter sp. BAB-5385]